MFFTLTDRASTTPSRLNYTDNSTVVWKVYFSDCSVEAVRKPGGKKKKKYDCDKIGRPRFFAAEHSTLLSRNISFPISYEYRITLLTGTQNTDQTNSGVGALIFRLEFLTRSKLWNHNSGSKMRDF